MAKGNRLDEFLDATRDLSLVAPRVDPSKVWRHIGEKLVNRFCAGLDLFGDCGRQGDLEGANAVLAMSVELEKSTEDI